MWPWSPSCYGDELLSNAGARPAPEIALTRCCRVPSSDLRRLFRAHECAAAARNLMARQIRHGHRGALPLRQNADADHCQGVAT